MGLVWISFIWWVQFSINEFLTWFLQVSLKSVMFVSSISNRSRRASSFTLPIQVLNPYWLCRDIKQSKARLTNFSRGKWRKRAQTIIITQYLNMRVNTRRYGTQFAIHHDGGIITWLLHQNDVAWPLGCHAFHASTPLVNNKSSPTSPQNKNTDQ